MKRAQGSLEYLIIIAAVIAIAAIVVLFLSSALQTQASSSTMGKCKQAASSCKVELSTSAGSTCPFCYEQCVNKEQTELFPGAYNFCLLGQPEKIYSGSVDDIDPTITFLNANPVTESNATITWTTDEPADSLIAYALCSNNPAATVCDNAELVNELIITEVNSLTKTDLEFRHSLTITSLASGSIYLYRVKSIDGTGNFVYSEFQEFTTA